jgi:hypothetical protein
VAVGKVATHLYLTLTIKELKSNVEHGRVVTTLNIIFGVAVMKMVSFETTFLARL